MTAKRGGLGKGLDSLIKENKTAKHTAPAKKEVVNAGPMMWSQTVTSQENILRKMLSWNLLIQSNSLESFSL